MKAESISSISQSGNYPNSNVSSQERRNSQLLGNKIVIEKDIKISNFDLDPLESDDNPFIAKNKFLKPNLMKNLSKNSKPLETVLEDGHSLSKFSDRVLIKFQNWNNMEYLDSHSVKTHSSKTQKSKEGNITEKRIPKIVNININTGVMKEGCSIQVANYGVMADSQKKSPSLPINLESDTKTVQTFQEFLTIFGNY